jgi:hypothetical protein
VGERGDGDATDVLWLVDPEDREDFFEDDFDFDFLSFLVTVVGRSCCSGCMECGPSGEGDAGTCPCELFVLLDIVLLCALGTPALWPWLPAPLPRLFESPFDDEPRALRCSAYDLRGPA